jgi:hypothetical protein
LLLTEYKEKIISAQLNYLCNNIFATVIDEHKIQLGQKPHKERIKNMSELHYTLDVM